MTEVNCIFCKISAGKDDKTKILYEDELIVVFRDIKPATPHHYLVTSKEHLPNAKQLNQSHIEMVEKMVATGKDIIQKQGGDPNDIRMGFHWPPFHLISHLHLHVISSTSHMGWIARGIFLPKSYWFVTADWVLERMRKMEAKMSST